MTITFREASIDDRPVLLDMMRTFFEIDGYPFDNDLTNNNLSHFLTSPSLGRIWIIQHDNATVGYIVLAFGFSFEYGGRDAFIDELFLVEAFRNKGIGSMAMSFVEQQAAILQVRTIHLEVEKHNAKGNRVYAKHGFTNNDRVLLSKRLHKKI